MYSSEEQGEPEVTDRNWQNGRMAESIMTESILFCSFALKSLRSSQQFRYFFSLKLSCILEDGSLGLQYKMMMMTHDKGMQVLLRRNPKYLCYNFKYLCSNRDGILSISILIGK